MLFQLPHVAQRPSNWRRHVYDDFKFPDYQNEQVKKTDQLTNTARDVLESASAMRSTQGGVQC
jgi:hypothetical protein